MNNVLVTGFGPFQGHDVNASWETVKLLPNNINGFNIVIKEVEVSYDAVETLIPELWKKYEPKLVIHVGVSSIADKITIETCARRNGYNKRDCKGSSHRTGTACSEGEDCIFGTIDPYKIISHIHDNKIADAITSTDAGRYLCEFIYYTSLKIDKSRTMFIHVPCLDKPYSAQELANGLVEIIKCALEQTSPCSSILHSPEEVDFLIN